MVPKQQKKTKLVRKNNQPKKGDMSFKSKLGTSINLQYDVSSSFLASYSPLSATSYRSIKILVTMQVACHRYRCTKLMFVVSGQLSFVCRILFLGGTPGSVCCKTGVFVEYE